jgi:DNA-binding NtrC family response regulator
MAAPAIDFVEELRDLSLPGGAVPVIESPATRKLMNMVHRVAPTSAAVLITGETGVGKELIARAIHHLSLRCGKAFVDINCGALPEHLVESELFGYEKGAFSGADGVKPGLFELAHEGTLFLDEIGELDPRVQVKLLRVLDGVPYYRLGGTRKVATSVRVVAASNRDLEEAVRQGKFRSDLYHRLSQVQIYVPPLRQRTEDIEAIAKTVLAEYKPGAHFAPEALDALRGYAWPGNIRELKNVIIRTALATDPHQYVIRTLDMPAQIRSLNGNGARVEEMGGGEDVPVGDLDSMERLMIERALERSGGDQGLAADQLGISRRTLSRKLKLYRLETSAPRTLGLLSGEQQRYFRASIDCAVRIRVASGEEITVQSVNLSLSGIGLHGVENPLQFVGPLEVSFNLPDMDRPVEAKGRMTWADAQGRAGVKFVSMATETQQRLDNWLTAKREQEGWA